MPTNKKPNRKLKVKTAKRRIATFGSAQPRNPRTQQMRMISIFKEMFGKPSRAELAK